MTDVSGLERFVREHGALLELERKTELEEAQRLLAELPDRELERRGVTLRKLVVADVTGGLGGRTTVVLTAGTGRALPAHRFSPGDVVSLRSQREAAGDDGRTGVVISASLQRVTVALDHDDDDELPDSVRLDRLAPDVTFRRMRHALRDLQRSKTPLRSIAFEGRAPAFAPEAEDFTALDPSLDASQREAVAFALRAHELALVHGPPGTGKTTTVVEIIRQAVQRGAKVLATAPSNVAVDNLGERLAAAGVRLVRLGHPARLLPSVIEHALETRVEQAATDDHVRAARRDLQQTQRRLARTRHRAERRQLRSELGKLRDELRGYEAATVRGILTDAQVVLATTIGAADSVLDVCRFDLAVVDEAAQAVEAACWIPLLRAPRAVLAGDHRQLPPTVVSMEAERRGLGRTLFERLAETFGDTAARMLTVQYRMHDAIMSWSSAAMYEGRLHGAEAVRRHLLADLPGVQRTPETGCPLLLIDTAGCGLEEVADPHGDSKANPGEAKVVAGHVESLLAAGVPPATIGVITPYQAQVQVLRERLGHHDELEIGTVDGFQGREKEAIVLSLVRSNDRGEIGFLQDRRRLNVAVTRARRHVAVIADSATLVCDPFLGGLIEHCAQVGEHRSAWELL